MSDSRMFVESCKSFHDRAVLAIAICAFVGSTGHAQEPRFEVPPVLEAASLLTPEVLRGEHHVVREAVANDGFMNTYTIDSDFGQFEAYGEPLLVLRLREIGALAELDELSRTKVFAEALAKGAVSQVTTVVEFAGHPVETVKGVPEGVKRMFKRTVRTVKKGAEVAKDLAEDSDGSEDGEEGTGEDSEGEDGALKEGAEAGQKYAKKYFGVSGAERRWAEKLGVDPYSANEVLRREIKKVAKVDAAGGLTVRLAPIPRIPGVSYIKDLSKLVWRTDPWELREINRKALVAMGGDTELVEEFLGNAFFNPSAQTFLVSVLSDLPSVEGRSLVVGLAALAESQEEASFFIQAIKMLAGFKGSGVQITELLGGGRLPGVLTGDARLVLLIPVDHIFWTEGIAAAADGPFAQVGKDLSIMSRELWFRGRVSERCRKELGARGWLVRDQVRFTAPASDAEQDSESNADPDLDPSLHETRESNSRAD